MWGDSQKAQRLTSNEYITTSIIYNWENVKPRHLSLSIWTKTVLCPTLTRSLKCILIWGITLCHTCIFWCLILRSFVITVKEDRDNHWRKELNNPTLRFTVYPLSAYTLNVPLPNTLSVALLHVQHLHPSSTGIPSTDFEQVSAMESERSTSLCA